MDDGDALADGVPTDGGEPDGGEDGGLTGGGRPDGGRPDGGLTESCEADGGRPDAAASQAQPGSDALRAFAHPLRLQMLSLLTAATMSAAEVARELGTTQANASYHLRRLEAVGLLDVVEEVKIRGGRARRYRHEPSSGRHLATRDPADAVLVAEGLAGELRRRAAYRDAAARGMTTDAELWVDPVVWTEIRDTVKAASTRLHREAQPPRTPGTVRVSATIAMFLMDPLAGAPEAS